MEGKGTPRQEKMKRETLTKIFLICTNTLGALTTAILVFGPASLNSSSANVLAVSSEYFISRQPEPSSSQFLISPS